MIWRALSDGSPVVDGGLIRGPGAPEPWVQRKVWPLEGVPTDALSQINPAHDRRRKSTFGESTRQRIGFRWTEASGVCWSEIHTCFEKA